jgi:hypothetical protein
MLSGVFHTDWEDPHHAPCCRAFNIDREIKTHDLTHYTERPAPRPEGPSWEEIRELIAALGEQ